MKNIVATLFALVMASCISPGDYVGKDSIDIHVENQTGSELTSVNVFVVQSTLINGKYQNARTDSSYIGTIATLKTAKGTLQEKNIQGVDGGYLLTATDKTGKNYSKQFGYLTNGAFLEKGLYLIVKQDTVLIKRL